MANQTNYTMVAAKATAFTLFGGLAIAACPFLAFKATTAVFVHRPVQYFAGVMLSGAATPRVSTFIQNQATALTERAVNCYQGKKNITRTQQKDTVHNSNDNRSFENEDIEKNYVFIENERL